jgi:hypothetical protein
MYLARRSHYDPSLHFVPLRMTGFRDRRTQEDWLSCALRSGGLAFVRAIIEMTPADGSFMMAPA